MGSGLLEWLGDRGPCEIAEVACYGHYAEEGYAAMAGIVADYLSNRWELAFEKNPE